MSKYYKIILGILIAVIGYLVYNNIVISKKNTELIKQSITVEEVFIEKNKHLIDSLMSVKLNITKELLSNENNIKKLKDQLKKIGNDSITLDEAKKLLGL